MHLSFVVSEMMSSVRTARLRKTTAVIVSRGAGDDGPIGVVP
jgi:hypothetical protein